MNSKDHGSGKQDSEQQGSGEQGDGAESRRLHEVSPVSSIDDLSPAVLIEILESQFSVQSNLCDSLEDIADSLPANVDVRLCRQVAQSLYPTILKAHSFEEDVLFPRLQSRGPDDSGLAGAIARLQGEHWEDESYAEEIATVLVDLGMGRTNHDPEKTGYMLRGFFGGLKRHIAFEKEYLIPLLKYDESA